VSPMPGLEGREKISPRTGFRSPDRPARSESLYRLSYPGAQSKQRRQQNFSLYITENKLVSGVVTRVTMVYGELNIVYFTHHKNQVYSSPTVHYERNEQLRRG
jgi:hypothetical protein